MVAPNPDRIPSDARPADRELQRHVREIVGSVASSIWRPATDSPVPVVQLVVAAGRPFRVTVDVVDCDAAIGGVMPVVTIREVSARQTMSRWLRDQFGLTAREARVAFLLARRRSNAEIARALDISPHTARRHTENVMHKMRLRSRNAVEQTIRSEISTHRRPKGGPAPARSLSAPVGAAIPGTRSRFMPA